MARATHHPNPNAPDYAIQRSSLKPNLKIVMRNAANPASPWVRLTVVGNIMWRTWKADQDIEAVEVQKPDGTRDYISLAAMGIIAYPDGRWSKNYAVESVW